MYNYRERAGRLCYCYSYCPVGLKVAVIEREKLGGICLNWGCIPTKSLLKSAQAYEYAVHAADYGVSITRRGET
jgi:pyruvate/2-oxoglutarate dehydrogenase complex dihydrolipoamide dehydrogenase (E3) component